MENRPAALAQRIETFLGAACQSARVGWAQSLWLEFEPPPGWGSKWPPVIKTYSCAWRVMKAGVVLAGQYDDEDYGRPIEAELAELNGRTLAGVELGSALLDARFAFSDDFAVEFFAVGRSDVAWSAQLFDTKHIDVGPGAAWREMPTDDPGTGFTAEEQRFSNHAHAFGQRWRSRMPPPSPSGRRCGKCAYWRPLPGGFDFWDFGVCSNARSSFDGTLVSLTTGCRRFSPELEQPTPSTEQPDRTRSPSAL